MNLRYSAYVPCCNNAATVRAAVESLLAQQPAPAEVLVIDDGSTDGGAATLAGLAVRVIRHERTLGRGAVRARAMAEAGEPLVLGCDATNVLPPDFFVRAATWLTDVKVAAVFGPLRDPAPRGAVGRWRARHLFKQDVGAVQQVRRGATLATYGTLLRADAAAAVGGFDATMRHSEDAQLGRRLLAAGHAVVFDPALATYCNVRNSLGAVLERYWRWHVGVASRSPVGAYFAALRMALTVMVPADLRAGDPLAAAISLACPHFQTWKSLRERGPTS
jgi:glycosyltransferase involved in cell wall biosynthesis